MIAQPKIAGPVVGKVENPENMVNMIENCGKYDNCSKSLMANVKPE